MIWNRSSNDKEPDQHGSSEVVFHPGGGFNKTGSFTESGDDTEYERQGYLTLEVVCADLAYARTWGLEKDYDNKDELADLNSETLSGKGLIQRAQWGRYSLSFLGSRRTHTTLDVSIRKSEAKHISVVPFKKTSDLDLSWDEHFALDVRLSGTDSAKKDWSKTGATKQAVTPPKDWGKKVEPSKPRPAPRPSKDMDRSR